MHINKIITDNVPSRSYEELKALYLEVKANKPYGFGCILDDLYWEIHDNFHDQGIADGFIAEPYQNLENTQLLSNKDWEQLECLITKTNKPSRTEFKRDFLKLLRKEIKMHSEFHLGGALKVLLGSQETMEARKFGFLRHFAHKFGKAKK